MDTRVPTLVASVLPTDFSELGQEVRQLEKAGVDRIQWDVMDGRFVPNPTFGPDVIAANRAHVSMCFEAHLMVADPDSMLARWVEAGCEIVIVHAEATRHLHRTLAVIGDLGARAGIALNPATPLEAVTNVLDLVDLLLVMTVNPGFGGQQYLAAMEPKIAAARAEIDRRELDIELEVDGGIANATIGAAARGSGRVLRRLGSLQRARHPCRPGGGAAQPGRDGNRGAMTLAPSTIGSPQALTGEVDRLAITTLRFLAADAVQSANSGHPGLPLGAAPVAWVLWYASLGQGLMGDPVIYVFTHDSVYVGEDGPTHQPIEHLESLRVIPGLTLLRPADAAETVLAWDIASRNLSGPTALVLTRQNLPPLGGDLSKVRERGFRVVRQAKDDGDVLIAASGSEVSLALNASDVACTPRRPGSVGRSRDYDRVARHGARPGRSRGLEPARRKRPGTAGGRTSGTDSDNDCQRRVHCPRPGGKLGVSG